MNPCKLPIFEKLHAPSSLLSERNPTDFLIIYNNATND